MVLFLKHVRRSSYFCISRSHRARAFDRSYLSVHSHSVSFTPHRFCRFVCVFTRAQIFTEALASLGFNKHINDFTGPKWHAGFTVASYYERQRSFIWNSPPRSTPMMTHIVDNVSSRTHFAPYIRTWNGVARPFGERSATGVNSRRSLDDVAMAFNSASRPRERIYFRGLMQTGCASLFSGLTAAWQRLHTWGHRL